MELAPADQTHLEHATGYFELEMLEDADAALDQIRSGARAMPPVLALRLAIAMRAKRWAPAIELAKHLATVDPDNPAWLTDLAYATRRAVNLEAAQDILRKAAQRFPQEALIQFNLGCYAAQLGQLEEARAYVRRAIAMDPSCRKLAREDPDLEPIRSGLEA